MAVVHVDAAVAAMLDDARRLAADRDAQAARDDPGAGSGPDGISVAHVSQIESGEVSTQDVLNRFITALGGTFNLIADSAASRSRSRDQD